MLNVIKFSSIYLINSCSFPQYAASAPDKVTIPLRPQLSLLLSSERVELSSSRSVDAGQDFALVCNVTLDVGHVAKITWTKDVSGTVEIQSCIEMLDVRKRVCNTVVFKTNSKRVRENDD